MEESRLTEIFKYLHQHPELGMEEKQTTEYIRGILSETVCASWKQALKQG